MKKFLPFMILLLCIQQAYSQQSQLLLSENFTGYTNGNLNGQGGWIATGSNNYVQVANSSPLTYPNYTSGTQYVNLVQRSGTGPDDPYKNFISNASIAPGNNPIFYISFVVRVPNASGTASTGSADQVLALRTSNGSNLAYFHMADNGGGSPKLKFGISKNGSAATYASANYDFNTTYLIIIRYDILNTFLVGSFDDNMYLWINPSLASEPSTGNAQVGIDLGDFKSDGGFSGNVTGLQLFQEQNSATASLDAIKVAYARNFNTTAATSLAAWNALSPIGAPLPVKFGDIKGYAKDKGVQIDWTVYTELNVMRYEIERSTDGVSFSKVGSVIAKNADGTLYYDWFDAAPLSGNNFYRIKNVDIDGKSSYSSVIKVSIGASSAERIAVYPNPVTGNHISLQAVDLPKDTYRIGIFNSAGQQIYHKEFSHGGGSIGQSIELPAGVKTGVYHIQLTGSGVKMARSFLVQ